MALVQAAPGTVLITGTTSGVGLYATKSLVERGWRVITANRCSIRAEASASAVGLPINRPRQLKHIQIDLGTWIAYAKVLKVFWRIWKSH